MQKYATLIIPVALILAACAETEAGGTVINPIPTDQQIAQPLNPLEMPVAPVISEPTLSPIADPFKTDPLLEGVDDVLADLKTENDTPKKETLECKEGEPYLYKGSLYCSNFFDE